MGAFPALPAMARPAGRADADGRVEVVGLEREEPSMASLTSANGPSVMSVWPPCTRTVVAVSGNAIGAPGFRPGLWFSAW